MWSLLLQFCIWVSYTWSAQALGNVTSVPQALSRRQISIHQPLHSCNYLKKWTKTLDFAMISTSQIFSGYIFLSIIIISYLTFLLYLSYQDLNANHHPQTYIFLYYFIQICLAQVICSLLLGKINKFVWVIILIFWWHLVMIVLFFFKLLVCLISLQSVLDLFFRSCFFWFTS